MPAYPPSSIEVVSPTSVAAPCKFDATAIAITDGTGDILSFLAIITATGATISTVATLSTKAEIIPENAESAMTVQRISGIFSIITSAMSAGIFESMKSDTVPIVPPIMSITFQSTA